MESFGKIEQLPGLDVTFTLFYLGYHLRDSEASAPGELALGEFQAFALLAKTLSQNLPEVIHGRPPSINSLAYLRYYTPGVK